MSRQVARAFSLGKWAGEERSIAACCLKEARRAGKDFAALKPYWR